jgi:hypothetical protein
LATFAAGLEPGALTISQFDRDDGWFAFVLQLNHPLLGEVIRQMGVFRECIVLDNHRNLKPSAAEHVTY